MAVYCLDFLRDEKNDGSDNLIFIDLLNHALAAGHLTLEKLPGIKATPYEMEKHRKNGHLAIASHFLNILRTGKSTCDEVHLDYVLYNLGVAKATPTDIGTCIDELALFVPPTLPTHPLDTPPN